MLIARHLDRALDTHTVWLTPWVLLAPSAIGTLQAGNVQLLFLVQSAAAMLLFERRRHALGGLLLAYAIVSKLYPGVLILYLLLRRNWRAVGWTTAAALALTLVTLADLGWTRSRVPGHLPKILSGEAFPGLSRPPALATISRSPDWSSSSGCSGCRTWASAAARVVGWIYTDPGGRHRVVLRRRATDASKSAGLDCHPHSRDPAQSVPAGYGAFPSLGSPS